MAVLGHLVIGDLTYCHYCDDALAHAVYHCEEGCAPLCEKCAGEFEAVLSGHDLWYPCDKCKEKSGDV